MKVLICDKTEKEYIEQMRAAGLTVDVRDDITPEELPNVLPAYDGMVVRSRTKVRQPLIDVCPNLKVIVRGGVGLDTIDHEYATSKGIAVMNTPMASSASVDRRQNPRPDRRGQHRARGRQARQRAGHVCAGLRSVRQGSYRGPDGHVG
jgi:hypothetical protein